MDLDATVKGATVGIEEVENMIAAIVSVPIDDGVDFNNPELAIAGTLLHGFEFLFVRATPFVFIGSVIGIIFTYRKR